MLDLVGEPRRRHGLGQVVVLLHVGGRALQEAKDETLGLPEHLRLEVDAAHLCGGCGALLGQVVAVVVRMLARALCDKHLVVSKRLRCTLEHDIFLRAEHRRLLRSLELAFAVLSKRVEDRGDGVLGGIGSQLAGDAGSPATALVAARYLDERCRDVDVVALVVDGLDAAMASIVLVPAVAMDVLALLARVSELCLSSID